SSMALSASATGKAIFGRGPDDDVTRDDLIASIHPDDRDLVLARLRRTIDTGRDYSIEQGLVSGVDLFGSFPHALFEVFI
ncbi:PAS domain-containing protein, partial [Rhizobium leguminosarum]|uniref:PAS domain-containing protein n=1 Tax=Rhizobium leguminosarum TaxID=384 RepID=UPI003F95230D